MISKQLIANPSLEEQAKLFSVLNGGLLSILMNPSQLINRVIDMV